MSRRSKKDGRTKPVLKEKRAKFLLNTLKENHDFDLVGEIVKTYREIDALQDPVERLRLLRSVQKDLMKYCFPTLKSFESHKISEATYITFNIPSPVPAPKKVKPLSIPQDDIVDVDGN
jgi:hypothetical protein